VTSLGLALRREGIWDFIALGALVHRLDPGVVPFRKAAECQIHVSGGEFNCAANLSDCFRLKTGIVTAMADYPVGNLIAERVKAMGVHPFYKWFQHDGVSGPNMAAVYGDRGYGVRAPVVFYNRANEAAALLKPGDFDWSLIFAGGVRWFHTGGIFASLSPSTPDLILEGILAARAAGAVVSFDLNYREKLWKQQGGEEGARRVFHAIVQQVDFLLCNAEDLQRRLGIPGPGADDDGTGSEAFIAMMDAVADRYPGIRGAATPLRRVISASRHEWSAAAWIDGQACVAPTVVLDVLDRVGSGDGFASGLFYGLLTGASPEESVRLGWAHGALLSTYPGDTTMATLEQVRALAEGGTARIQR